MSVEELCKLLPKELIDVGYKLPPKMGDFAWRGDDFKKVISYLVKIKRMVAGGDIWVIKGDEVEPTGSVWDWEADKINQSQEPEKWYQAAIGEIEKWQAFGDEYYFTIDLYAPNQGSPKFKK